MSTLQTVKHNTKRNNLYLRVATGHFATNNRHLNYYIDVSAQKTRLNEAQAIAEELKSYFYQTTLVDTILCLDGTEVIGTCLADKITRGDYVSLNAHNTIYVATPETNSSGQLLFRDNTSLMVAGKNVLILAVSYSSGKTVEAAVDAVKYYGGNVTGICAIFSTVERSRSDVPVYSCFNPEFLDNYSIYPSHDCPMCKAGQKIDALINGFGYSLIK